jgi:hypothetical protein
LFNEFHRKKPFRKMQRVYNVTFTDFGIVKTRADNSGYTNHRVTCLVVMGSSFDSEQIC